MEIAPLLGAGRKPQLTTGGGEIGKMDKRRGGRGRWREGGREGGTEGGKREGGRQGGREGGRCKSDAKKKESARE